MNKIISIFTFVIWFCYFLHVIKYLLANIKITKKTTIKDLIFRNYKKVFKILPTIFILIFFIFSNFHNNLVNKMLFFTINLYFFVDFIMENKNIDSLHKCFKKNKLEYIIIFIIAFLPIIFYFLTNKLKITYFWLFIYTYFAYFIVASIKLFTFKVNSKK